MDKKTLEYMGERVDEGRKIQKAINDLNNRLTDLKGHVFAESASTPYVGLSGSGERVTFGRRDYESIAEGLCEYAIVLVEKEIERLEKLFAEL